MSHLTMFLPFDDNYHFLLIKKSTLFLPKYIFNVKTFYNLYHLEETISTFSKQCEEKKGIILFEN